MDKKKKQQIHTLLTTCFPLHVQFEFNTTFTKFTSNKKKEL